MKPALPGYEDLDTTRVSMGEVAEYLNKVVAYWGPPCDFCGHLQGGCYCSKGRHPSQRSLSLGPWADWRLLRHCKDFSGDADQDQSEELRKLVSIALDCDAQMHGG